MWKKSLSIFVVWSGVNRLLMSRVWRKRECPPGSWVRVYIGGNRPHYGLYRKKTVYRSVLHYGVYDQIHGLTPSLNLNLLKGLNYV
jgi:hypothetical protein